MRILIGGASGMVGTALKSSMTRDGSDVTTLVRREAKSGEIFWNPQQDELDARKVDGFDAVIHLSGAPIAQRWTPAYKDEIRSSRVKSTALLANALAKCHAKPKVLVVASGVGYYGAQAAGTLTEQSPTGSDFLAEVCQEWESAADPAREAGIRVVHMRTGVVLDKSGGMIRKLLPLFRLGLGGRIGDGKMWLSWVTLKDILKMYSFAIENAQLEGPVNAVSPNPVTNADFTKAFARAVKRPALLPVPSFALRLLFGEMADATILASQRAIPEVLLREGFPFSSTTIEEAMSDVFGSRHTRSEN